MFQISLNVFINYTINSILVDNRISSSKEIHKASEYIRIHRGPISVFMFGHCYKVWTKEHTLNARYMKKLPKTIRCKIIQCAWLVANLLCSVYSESPSCLFPKHWYQEGICDYLDLEYLAIVRKDTAMLNGQRYKVKMAQTLTKTRQIRWF